jgi:ribosomal protein L32
MGAQPKRRISSGRRGRRRLADALPKKVVKHHLVARHKVRLVDSLKKVLGIGA